MKNNKFEEWKKSRKKIYWKNIPSEELTWSEAMLEIEGLVNEEVSKLMKKRTDQSTELALLLNKSLNIIKRGY
mgnify:FL=1|tara:strand:- start:1068 stop:1286 length:219 start_codon:yes stop_codon:yes gene_type:complete